MANLPEEIIEDNILTRLPVKSISRFRCVSKNWRSLFQNPNFIQKHLHHANLLNEFNILVSNDDTDVPPTESHLYSIHNNALSSPSSVASSYALQMEYPLMSGESMPLILGSCNGLVCIEPFYYNILIWNPATREYKRLPEHLADSNNYIYNFRGFGFDCKNDDYKVLKIGKSPEGEDAEARLYSLASNSWKNLGVIPYDFSFSKQKGLFHDGVLHWMAYRLESWVIVCFDISDETFHEVPFPKNNSNEDEDERFMSELGIWEGKLCLLHTNHMEDHVICTHENDHIDVLTMIDNKWSKHLKITAQITDMSYHRPFQTLQNGEILLEGGPRGEGGFGLMAYDLNLQRARVLKIHDFPDMLWPEVETYIETLVALNSGTYVGQVVVAELKARVAELEAQIAVLMFMVLPWSH